MVKLGNLKIEENEAMEEFRDRMKGELKPEMFEDDLLFYRFLKARNFDINKSEAMLRKHLQFRKAKQVDTILQDFKPKEAFLKQIGRTILGTDKEGSIIMYLALGRTVVPDISKCYKYYDFIKHLVWTMESSLDYLKTYNLKTRSNNWKVTFLINLDQLEMSNVCHPLTATILLYVCEKLQDNYPEILKSVIVLNAPSYYQIAHTILKKVLVAEIIQKFQIYGQSGWKKALLKVIDPNVLPAFLGGKRTDPDGNPKCNTFVCHSGKLPEKYYLSKEDRTFKDKSQVTQVSINPRDTYQVNIEVKKSGSVIEWEFEVPKKDIGVGLYYKDSEDNLEETIPVNKFETLNGTEGDSHKCQREGTYVILFDNTYSWLNRKELSYCIKVVNS